MTDESNEIQEPPSEATSDAQASQSASEVTPDAASEAAPPSDAPETSPVAQGETGQSEPAQGEESQGEATQGQAPADPSANPETGADGVAVEDPTGAVEAEVEYIEDGPRVKPAIPGADLVPDIVPEGNDFLDAEARAAAEADAEEAAKRAAADEPELDSQPIADAAIDLAAGARYHATGKRKTGVARVILRPGTGNYSINGKSLEEFFPRETLRRVIRQPLEAVGYETKMDVSARMHGGGVAAQAGALRHGISRALLEADPNLRGELKRRGFLTRDPRVKERKKAGLKKARKRPQFSKR